MAFISAVPVASSARLSLAQCAVRPASSTAFSGAQFARRAVVPNKAAVTTTPRMFEISEGVEFEFSITVIGLALVGWILPSSIPTSIPLTDGSGLSQAFFNSMNSNLANWPQGPAMDDPFWLLMFLWHVGMFACLIFGTIGYNLNKIKKAEGAE